MQKDRGRGEPLKSMKSHFVLAVDCSTLLTQIKKNKQIVNDRSSGVENVGRPSKFFSFAKVELKSSIIIMLNLHLHFTFAL